MTKKPFTTDQITAYKRMIGLRHLRDAFEPMVGTLSMLMAYEDNEDDDPSGVGPTIAGLTAWETQEALEPFHDIADAWCRGLWQVIDPTTVPPGFWNGNPDEPISGFTLYEELAATLDDYETDIPEALERKILGYLDPGFLAAIERRERLGITQAEDMAMMIGRIPDPDKPAGAPTP